MKILCQLALIVASLIPTVSIAQKDTLFVETFYKDVSTLLVYEKIIEVDSTPINELMNRLDNWGGQNFADYEKVRTGKTANQITLNYISNAHVHSFYVNLIAEFKDNKVRLRFYDGGNCYRPPQILATLTIPALQARTRFLTAYFADKGKLLYKTKSDGTIKPIEAAGLLNYKQSIEATCKTIEEFLRNSGNSKPKKDDW